MEKPARQPSVIKLTAIPYNRLSAAVGTVADRTWEPYRRAVTNRCAEWMLNYRRAPRQGQALRREKRNVNLNTSNPAMSAAACRAALLTLCLGLVAVHPAAAAPQTSSAPAAETISDEDMDPGLDDSYNVADLRPQYKACIDASDAVMPKVQACQEQEFVYQRGRMRAALARIDAGPDSYFKDEIGNWQHIYMQSTDISCTNLEERGPAGEGLSCRINRYANRARALEGLADMADKAYAKGN
ncbi:hypothetical protein [Stenotrophomonas sp.]|uniref:hypothetical protein n=1 Tax=Stenotrophomonas sp. TaxID=69392 RepID=UPI0028A8EFD1|nr:hypothetical protein [Stenotrophomonas sp.]